MTTTTNNTNLFAGIFALGVSAVLFAPALIPASPGLDAEFPPAKFFYGPDYELRFQLCRRCLLDCYVERALCRCDCPCEPGPDGVIAIRPRQ